MLIAYLEIEKKIHLIKFVCLFQKHLSSGNLPISVSKLSNLIKDKIVKENCLSLCIKIAYNVQRHKMVSSVAYLSARKLHMF